MIENRELNIDDYLAMLRRRAKVIVFPMVLAPLIGFLISYFVTPKYTSQSVILVEGQKVPENMVQPVVSDDLQTRIQMLRAVATSDTEMKPVLISLFPNRSSQDIDAMLDDMRTKQPDLIGVPFADLSQIMGSNVRKKPGQATSPGFFVSYIAPNPREAQQVCEALTSKIIQKNGQFIQDNAKGTVDVLNQGLENAKNSLDAMDAKMAEFKKQYAGKLPGDEENNLKLLGTLSSQLDANTQTLNRAQQDKSYTESLLAQQLASWKASQSSTNPDTLQKQLSDLQSQLLQLQARYTSDYPDVIKTKADIAEVKAKLAEVDKSSGDADTTIDKGSASEPLEIRQMRLQVHQYEDAIVTATREQKRLQPEILALQGRVSLSPAVEQQFEQLTRDYGTAKKTYEDLLADKSKADLTANMTSQAQGESMKEIQPASFPDSPSFPNRLLFAAGGLAAGLALGGGIALWLELRDNSIRTEADAEAALQLPLLVAVPWVGSGTEEESAGKFWQRKKKQDAEKETVSV